MAITQGARGVDVVENLRRLAGPEDPFKAKETAPDSIRAIYGTDVDMNAIHVSRTLKKAEKWVVI